jgi:hypothetical protein
MALLRSIPFNRIFQRPWPRHNFSKSFAGVLRVIATRPNENRSVDAVFARGTLVARLRNPAALATRNARES